VTQVRDQIERIQWLLQDNSTSPTIKETIIAAHRDSAQRLARHNMFTQIQWINAVANQSLYTLDMPAVDVIYVLYDERVLRYASENALDRFVGTWESQKSQPEYWTQDNQNPNIIRIVPAPQATGSAVPVYPSPLIQDTRGNLIIFYVEDVESQITAEDNTLPTLLDWDDVLVWDTTRMLAERETHTQNLPVAQLCKQLTDLWMQLMEKK
jgi:hypothetical protein